MAEKDDTWTITVDRQDSQSDSKFEENGLKRASSASLSSLDDLITKEAITEQDDQFHATGVKEVGISTYIDAGIDETTNLDGDHDDVISIDSDATEEADDAFDNDPFTIEVKALLEAQPVDLDALYSLSRKAGGFRDNRIRQLVWPKFLAINRYEHLDFRTYATKPGHTIRVDVDRSFVGMTYMREWSEALRSKKRVLLSDIITAILARNSNLEYYQGFHDVCVVFIEVCDQQTQLAFAMLEKLSLYYLTDFMGKDFDTVLEILPLMLEIIKRVDKKLHNVLVKPLTEPYFATSWVITWFAHDLKDFATIARIYDALVCSHPLFVLYMATALVIAHRKEIFKLPCDMAAIHNYLVNINERSTVDYNKLIIQADRLIQTLPPSRLHVFGTPSLRAKIESKRVTIFVKPPCITKYCDSDEKLFREFLSQRDARRSQKAMGSVMVNQDLLYWVGSALAGGLVGAWGWSSATK